MTFCGVRTESLGMRLHEDRVFQDILFGRDLFSVGLEALHKTFDCFFHYLNGLSNSVAVRDAALEGGDNGGESPFRFLPEKNTITDLFLDDHLNRIVRMNLCSLPVPIIDMDLGVEKRDEEERRRIIAANRGSRGLAYREDRTMRGGPTLSRGPEWDRVVSRRC